MNIKTNCNNKHKIMAGNKHNTAFAIHKPTTYSLKYLDHYGDEIKMTGTPQQIINHILKQQL
jgi:hypothetical protein